MYKLKDQELKIDFQVIQHKNKRFRIDYILNNHIVDIKYLDHNFHITQFNYQKELKNFREKVSDVIDSQNHPNYYVYYYHGDIESCLKDTKGEKKIDQPFFTY